MGYFLAASAIRDIDEQDAQRKIIACMAHFGVTCEQADGGTDNRRDILVFPQFGRWTVVLWPEYFNIHDVPCALQMTAAGGCAISTVHTYDSDYWTHVLCERGSVVDRFCSEPAYFAEDEVLADRLRTEWAGDAAVLAKWFGIDPQQVAPYLIHRRNSEPAPSPQIDGGAMGWLKRLFGKPIDKRPSGPPAPLKAFPDDEFDLDNFWVFTDFWRRVGIIYPPDPSACVVRLRLGADSTKQLPTGTDDDL